MTAERKAEQTAWLADAGTVGDVECRECGKRASNYRHYAHPSGHDCLSGCPEGLHHTFYPLPTESEPERETIVGPAIMWPDRSFSWMPTPGSHYAVSEEMKRQTPHPSTTPLKWPQGFVTSEHRFVNRKVARQIAEAAGQIVNPITGGEDLFSEELWTPPPAPETPHDDGCGGCDLGICTPSETPSPEVGTTCKDLLQLAEPEAVWLQRMTRRLAGNGATGIIIRNHLRTIIDILHAVAPSVVNCRLTTDKDSLTVRTFECEAPSPEVGMRTDRIEAAVRDVLDRYSKFVLLNERPELLTNAIRAAAKETK